MNCENITFTQSRHNTAHTTKCDENIICLKSINCFSALIRTKSEIIK